MHHEARLVGQVADRHDDQHHQHHAHEQHHGPSPAAQAKHERGAPRHLLREDQQPVQHHHGSAGQRPVSRTAVDQPIVVAKSSPNA